MHSYDITRVQPITILAHMQVITMRSLGEKGAVWSLFHLLCWHHA